MTIEMYRRANKFCTDHFPGNWLGLAARVRAQSVRQSIEGSPRRAARPQMIETVPKVDPQRAGRRNKKHGIPHTLNFLGRDQRRPGKAQAASVRDSRKREGQRDQ